MASSCIAQDIAPPDSSSTAFVTTLTTESAPLIKESVSTIETLSFTVSVTESGKTTHWLHQARLVRPHIAASGTVTVSGKSIIGPLNMREWNRLRNGSPPHTYILIGPDEEELDLLDISFSSATPESGVTLQTDSLPWKQFKKLKPGRERPKRLPRKSPIFIEPPQVNDTIKPDYYKGIDFVAKLLAFFLMLTMSIFVVGTLFDKAIKAVGTACRDTAEALGLAVTYILLGIMFTSFVFAFAPIALVVCIGLYLYRVAVDTWRYNKMLGDKRREAAKQQAQYKREQERKKRETLAEKQRQLEEEAKAREQEQSAEEKIRDLKLEREAALLAAEIQELILREAKARKATILVEADIAGLSADALIAKARGEDPRAKLDLNQGEVDFDNTLGG